MESASAIQSQSDRSMHLCSICRVSEIIKFKQVDHFYFKVFDLLFSLSSTSDLSFLLFSITFSSFLFLLLMMFLEICANSFCSFFLLSSFFLFSAMMSYLFSSSSASANSYSIFWAMPRSSFSRSGMCRSVSFSLTNGER